MKELSEKQQELLINSIIDEPEMIDLLKNITSMEELSRYQLLKIVDLIGIEEMQNGLKQNLKPNKYGLELEKLQDVLLRICYKKEKE